jgi:hypothetical protein
MGHHFAGWLGMYSNIMYRPFPYVSSLPDITKFAIDSGEWAAATVKIHGD